MQAKRTYILNKNRKYIKSMKMYSFVQQKKKRKNRKKGEKRKEKNRNKREIE